MNPRTKKIVGKTPDLLTGVKSAFKMLQEIQKKIAADAPALEKLIASLDVEVSRALKEDDNSESPLCRKTAYLTHLWAQHGWFASTWKTPISLIGETAHYLGKNQHEEAEAIIMAHFRNQIPSYVKRLAKNHPTRKPIIEDAFEAHLNQKYTLSIPAFLIQADGIGAEFFDVDSIYTVSNQNIAKISQKYDQVSQGFKMRYVFFLLGTLTPLNASRKKRDRYSDPFNRHQVIHGESTQYPSEANSLKAISWLYFMSELIEFSSFDD